VRRHAGRAGLRVRPTLAEHAPPAVGRTDLPRGPISHRLPRLAGFVGQEPVAELEVLTVGVEERVRPVRFGSVGTGDRPREPPVVGLASEVEHPARHRDRHPHKGAGGGQITDERVHFPGRFACDRYAAARRSTSFSCSSSRIRLRASRNSAVSAAVGPGLPPTSRSAADSQFVKHDSLTPKSAAICFSV